MRFHHSFHSGIHQLKQKTLLTESCGYEVHVRVKDIWERGTIPLRLTGYSAHHLKPDQNPQPRPQQNGKVKDFVILHIQSRLKCICQVYILLPWSFLKPPKCKSDCGTLICIRAIKGVSQCFTLLPVPQLCFIPYSGANRDSCSRIIYGKNGSKDENHVLTIVRYNMSESTEGPNAETLWFLKSLYTSEC